MNPGKYWRSVSALNAREFIEANRLADPLANVQTSQSPVTALPDRWAWMMLGELGGFLGGGTPSKTRDEYWNGDIPWVSPKDMKRPYISDAIDHVTMRGAEASSGKMIPAGALLMVVRGMILAHSFPVALTERELVINQDMKALALVERDIGEYVLRCCGALKDNVLALVERSSHGTCRLSSDAIASFWVPLPPLAEQKLIVAKVDELMALCDQLEAQQRERETRKSVLVRASLARFAGAPTPANLGFLFHKSHDIPPAEFRKAILMLAVQGKLMPQDPRDEPAEMSLSRLGLNNTLVQDETHNALPATWCCVRFEDVALTSGGVTLGRKLGDRRTVSLPYLRVANVKRGDIDLDDVKEVAIAEDEIERYALRTNDLLMTEGGDWDKVGRAAIWRGQISLCLHQNHIFRLRMKSDEMYPEWFECYFNSPAGRTYFEIAAKQTTNLASINMRQVRNCPVSVPPLPEQRRIVAKVDQLMALVDELERQQESSRTTASKLLDAIVHELTGAT